mmetsp:Transcript_734/g.1190  ORF Transcript_734/g.1190 Transcript_734/m.1190 type:complete len:172 (+) Transcript_734:377-892(+)
MECDPQVVSDDSFSEKLQFEFNKLRHHWADVFNNVLERSEIFSPLNFDKRTEDWTLLMAAGILYHLQDAHSELVDQAREDLSQKLLQKPPHLTLDPSSPKASQPPPSPALPSTVPNPADTALSHGALTPKTKPSESTMVTIPPFHYPPLCHHLLPRPWLPLPNPPTPTWKA